MYEFNLNWICNRIIDRCFSNVFYIGTVQIDDQKARLIKFKRSWEVYLDETIINRNLIVILKGDRKLRSVFEPFNVSEGIHWPARSRQFIFSVCCRDREIASWIVVTVFYCLCILIFVHIFQAEICLRLRARRVYIVLY